MHLFCNPEIEEMVGESVEEIFKDPPLLGTHHAIIGSEDSTVRRVTLTRARKAGK